MHPWWQEFPGLAGMTLWAAHTRALQKRHFEPLGLNIRILQGNGGAECSFLLKASQNMP